MTAPESVGDCQLRLNGGPLVCTRTTGHPPGCTFIASSSPDGHTLTEDQAERERG